MTERIKELYEQAIQLVADECTKGDVSRLNTDSYHVKDLINEKFAEILIKDFLFQLAYARMEHVFDHKVDEVFKKTIADVKKHYGVEE